MWCVSTEEEPAARILVVEHDPEARATFDLLLGTRWAVTLAERGDQGRDQALGSAFDLVIANVEMPGLSGIELARQLRGERSTQDVPLILMSRTSGQRETIAGLEAGADDFLVKPFSGRELLVRVQTRLELTSMRRRNAQQEEALASLQRTLQVRDEFLSAASHELRTPITTLSLQTEGLLASAESTNGHSSPVTDRLHRRLSAIRRQVVRLNQLVDQLLDVSQFVEGRLDLRPEEIDLQSLVIEAIDLMRDSAVSAGSPVLFRMRNEVVGHWDRLRLGQVVTNLLSNAIKFGCGRPIEVELDADAAFARLEVKDSGEGIPSAGAGPNLRPVRTGDLGEASSRPRPRALDLQADRRRLPRDDLGGERAWPGVHLQRRASEGVVNERPRLLIVDDDIELCESMADVLTDAGYDAVTAHDARRALRLSRHGPPPCLILLDLMMPEMTGWQFRERQLRDQRTRDIPVVIMTASREVGRHPMRAGALLLKPFTLDELLEQVESFVASA